MSVEVPAMHCSDGSEGGGGRFTWMSFSVRMVNAVSGYGPDRSFTVISLFNMMELT
jgi:hypothetical protein